MKSSIATETSYSRRADESPRGHPFSWLANIPARDWWRHAPAIAAGYALVFVCVTHLSGSFTDNERQFLSFLTEPLTAFWFSVFITVLLQASFITEFSVVFAAGGLVSVPVAVALVLGGNVGTCITNTVVSFLSSGNREQFQRSFSASIVHDLFNIFMVWIVLPAELTTGFFSRHVIGVARALGASDSVAQAFQPPAGASGLGVNPLSLLAVIGTLAGIVIIVINLKKLFFERMAHTLKHSVFTSRLRSVAVGIGFTFLVQSSSLSTSVVVPSVGDGTLSLSRAFYYLLGCNVGTAIVTIVFTLPVMFSGSVSGTAVALSHLLFNFYGVILFLAVPSLGLALCAVAEAISVRAGRMPRVRLALTLAVVYYALPAAMFAMCLIGL